MVRFVAAAAALALAATVANAQVQQETFAPLSKTLGLKSAATSVLPRLDVLKMAAPTSPTKDREGGEEFGLDQFINADSNKIGEWTQTTGENWVWTYTVQSEGARGMMPVFSKWAMPKGGKFMVYSDADKAGSFNAKNNKAHGQFAVRPLRGDTITMEYNGPRVGLELEVEKVIHVYRGLFEDPNDKNFGRSGSCNMNTVCTVGDEWREQIDSVTVLLNTASRGYCSGSMINNHEGLQMFLTAAHCGPGANDIILFNYDSPICPYPGQDVPYTDTAHGLPTLARATNSDFQLTMVEEEIPDSYHAYLNGWDARPFSNGDKPYDDVWGIHHPSVDVKKISRSSMNGATSSGYGGPNGDTHWWVKTWEIGRNFTEQDYGTTEGGSSGSPLFNCDKQIIGQLHGGQASCTNNVNDYYGALWKSFPAIEEYLTGGTGELQMGGEYLAGVSRPPTVPPAPTPAPPPTANPPMCDNNSCVYAFDVDCDDGGSGSDYSLCSYGTDCNDCCTKVPSRDECV
jgi:V8-like Glu-specific endopeptidase